MDEYKMLREEIMSAITSRRNHNGLLYTISIALLTYAFDAQDPILFLLPFTVIFPFYSVIIKETHHELRIGAYIYVFIEKSTNIHWEQRIRQYDFIKESSKHSPFSLGAYSGISFLCVFLSFLYTDHSMINFSNVFCTILQIVLLIVSSYMFVIKKPNYKEIKEQYILEWEAVKETENS